MDDKQMSNKSYKIGEKEFVVRTGWKQWAQIIGLIGDIDLQPVATVLKSIMSKIDLPENEAITDDDLGSLMKILFDFAKAGIMPELLSYILKPIDNRWNEADAKYVCEYFEEEGEELTFPIITAFFLSNSELMKKMSEGLKS